MTAATFINGRGEVCTGCGKPLPHDRCRGVDDNNGDLTVHELEEAAKRLCRLHWNREFTGKIEVVNRMWSSQYGAYYYNVKNPDRQTIRFSGPLNKTRTRDQVLATLLHELVHWHLHTSGKPFGDEDIEFAAECLRIGAKISGTQKARKAAERALQLCNTSA